MRSFLAALTAGAGLVSTIGAQAQNLYVPLTSTPGDGTALELVVVNPDPDLTRVFSGTILAEGHDGVSDPGTPTEQIGVAPGSTRVIAGPGGIGLWRLKGFSGLQVSARLRVPGGASQHQGAAVPILSLRRREWPALRASDTVRGASAQCALQTIAGTYLGQLSGLRSARSLQHLPIEEHGTGSPERARSRAGGGVPPVETRCRRGQALAGSLLRRQESRLETPGGPTARDRVRGAGRGPNGGDLVYVHG